MMPTALTGAKAYHNTKILFSEKFSFTKINAYQISEINKSSFIGSRYNSTKQILNVLIANRRKLIHFCLTCSYMMIFHLHFINLSNNTKNITSLRSDRSIQYKAIPHTIIYHGTKKTIEYTAV